MNYEYFKISSGLKNLIGSELITDSFAAVFELVKNSFDARATEVKIIFENIYSEKSRIIIIDNGKGMNYEDILTKWLFVAYSAKKDGTEDKNNSIEIKEDRYYAGAKGVGRFSCDRLGRYLNLISVKDEVDAKIEQLKVDWTKFEENPKAEFIEIPVEHNTLDSIDYNLKHGTVLEISGVNNDDWNNRDSFKKLKQKLSKLIRPDLNHSFNKSRFKIILDVVDELKNDDEEIKKGKLKGESEGYFYYNTINGEIRNYVFDEMDIRTTKIVAKISDEGELETELVDRNVFIYKLVENNKYNLLRNVSITLYFLNQAAKAIFKRRTGIQPIEYGNILVYKNGFRIYPYGERGDDSLGIDTRALQSYGRFIALRNLIGLIDIQGNNSDLNEATSRDAGLVKTKAYYQLADVSPFADSLLVNTLKRLEKYVVEVTQWGINDDAFEIRDSINAKESLVKLISNIYDDKAIISIKYNTDIINILDQKEEKSAKKLLTNFKRVAAESNDEKLFKDAVELEKKINYQTKVIDTVSKDLEIKIKEENALKKQLEQQVSETLFARAVVGTESKELLSIQHHIHRHAAQHITSFIDKLVVAVNNDSPKAELLEIINKIAFENKKIITLSRFVTKAHFDTTTNKIHADLVRFINEYVVNVYKEYAHLALNNQSLEISIVNTENLFFTIDFKPIEIIIILDNLLNNSFKARSKKVELIWRKIENEKNIILSIVDDGIGIPDENLSKIFDFRFSTTDGSGLGLYHVKDIIEKMRGKIIVNNKLQQGVEFVLTFSK